MKRPEVLFLLNDLRWGGAERQVDLLVPRLHKMGLSVAVAGMCGTGPLAETLKQAGIACHAWPMPFPWSRVHRWHYLPRLALRLRSVGPRVVVGLTHVPNVYGAMVRRLAGVREFVWCQRDSGIGRLPAWMERAAVRRATRFTANAEAGADFLRDALGVAAGQAILLPNAVAAPTPAPGAGDAVRRSLGCPPAAPVLLMAGNLRAPKDPQTAIRALVELGEIPGRGRPELWLAGREEELAAPCRELCASLGVADRVRFLGVREDLDAVRAASDAAVHCSDHEGQPNAVLEAMAAGLPVAATDLPGTRALLRETAPGLLVPPHDPAALAAALRPLLEQRANARGVGIRLREHALAEHGLDAAARRWFYFLTDIRHP